jgi:hypothetical protein
MTMREPFEKIAKERCQCGLYQMVPSGWDIVQRRRGERSAHMPRRLGGCPAPGEQRMHYDPEVGLAKSHYLGDSCPGGHRNEHREHIMAPPKEKPMEAAREETAATPPFENIAAPPAEPEPPKKNLAAIGREGGEASGKVRGHVAQERVLERVSAPDFKLPLVDGFIQTNAFCRAVGCSKTSLYRHATALGLRPAKRGRLSNGGFGAYWSAADAEKIVQSLAGAGAEEAAASTVHLPVGFVLPAPHDGRILTTQLAKALHRATESIRNTGERFGFKSIVTAYRGNAVRTWAIDEAKAIAAYLLKAKVVNSRRKNLPKVRPSTIEKLTGVAPVARRVHRKRVAEPPERPATAGEKADPGSFGKWLMLQMERGGVTFAHYEKGQGIKIRRQRVVEDEEEYT